MDSRFKYLVDGRHFSDEEYAAVVVSPGAFQNYYVDDVSGVNTPSGGTLANPFKTISYALHADRTPSNLGRGCRVMIKTGYYYEKFAFSNYAPHWGARTEESHRIIVGPYGDGPVIVDASIYNSLGSWYHYAGNVWAVSTGTKNVRNIIIDDDMHSYHPVQYLGDVVEFGDWWHDTTNKILYVHTNNENPQSKDVVVMENNYYNEWNLGNSTTYVTLTGLTLRGHSGSIYFYNTGCHHINVNLCKIMYVGRSGLTLPGGSSYFNITKNYFRAAGMYKHWPRGRTDESGGWQSFLSSTGSNHIFSGNIVFDCGGEGINNLGNTNTVEDNICCDNFSVNFYHDGARNSISRRNISICTGYNVADYGKYPLPVYHGAKIKRAMIPMGFGLADEYQSNFNNNQIYNNISIGCRYGFTYFKEGAGSETAGFKNTKIFNNLIVLPYFDGATLGDTHCGLRFLTNSNNTGSSIKNNIIIGTHASNRLIERGSDGGIAIDNNIYYHSLNSLPFRYNSVNYNFTNWKTQSGQDASSLNQDPLLEKTDWTILTNLSVDDLKLQVLSPAINAGVDLGSPYNYDYDLVERLSGLWNLGPFQHYRNKNYTKGIVNPLATTDADLSTPLTATEKSTIITADSIYITHTASNQWDDDSGSWDSAVDTWNEPTGPYAIFQFKDKNQALLQSNITITAVLKSNIPCTQSTIYLQIYNRVALAWETLDSDALTAADTNLTLSGSKSSNLANYYDSNFQVACRIYQEVKGI